MDSANSPTKNEDTDLPTPKPIPAENNNYLIGNNGISYDNNLLDVVNYLQKISNDFTQCEQ